MSVRTSCVLGACVLLAGTAAASPLDDPTAGRAVFTGAATPHATSLLLNPAALALPPGTTGLHLYAGGTLTMDQISVDRSEIDLATGELTPGASASAFEWGLGGTFALWNVTSSRNLAVGGLIASPQATTPFATDEDALRYHTLGGVHRTTQLLSVAAAYRIVSRFYFGGSISLTRNRVKLSFARDTALEAGRDPARGITSDCGGGVACGVENPAASERYTVDASPLNLVATENLTVRLSALVEIYPDWWIGATWRLPNTDVELSGDGEVVAAPRDGGGVQRGTAIVHFDLPTSIDAELRGRIAPAIDLHVGARWVDLSVFSDYDVRLVGFDANVPEWIERPLGYHDTVRAWAGIEQVDTGRQRFLFGVRGGVIAPEIAKSRVSPMTIDRWGGTADGGVQWRIATGFVAQLSYGLEYRPDVDVRASRYNPRDRLGCMDSGYDYATAACENVRDGYAIPTAAGRYRRIDHAIRVGLRYDFQ